jgi:hypothetical protein
VIKGCLRGQKCFTIKEMNDFPLPLALEPKPRRKKTETTLL